MSGSLELDGLSAPVRVVRDTWGVPHIYAANQDDLFFAQGFVQAGDRLFQMDLWRRAAQGRLAEVLGSNFAARDATTRRIQYRGDIEADWAGHGPDTKAVATAFVRGINAWVAVARDRPPAEFVLAGWLPEPWRPEDLLNRTDAFVASAQGIGDVFRARLVTAVGPARAAALLGDDAAGAVPSGIDLTTVTYQVGDILRQIGTRPFFTSLAGPFAVRFPAQDFATGSNAWAIAAARSATGRPMLAADPHRLLTNPAGRYLVHLSAPGWNVAGATSPWLPGVVIGHNDRVAWGMTTVPADTADLFVERVNPENSHQIERAGRWQNTTVVRGALQVKGRERPTPFDREYTPHGVVIGVDRERHLAFTLRWSGMEPGGAAELAALGLNRAVSGAGIREALAHWKTPSVEVVYADRDGDVGTQVAAHIPVRTGWNGRLPVPGWLEGNDWSGWIGPKDLPNAAAAATGFVASANGNRARTARLRGALSSGMFSVEDFARLQRDVHAWNAERLIPLLAGVRSDRADVEQARQQLLGWDRRVTTDSAAATLYVTWERVARRLLAESRVPAALVEELVEHTTNMFVPALTQPSRLWFDGNAALARDRFLVTALVAAVDEVPRLAAVAESGGPTPSFPAWGRVQQVSLAHPLAITDAARRRFNVGPFARPGYADTLMSTVARRADTAVGASFAAIFDTSDWDRSIVQNAPGQSESPGSPHFSDLAALWDAGQYFPLAFSEAAVAANTESTLLLVPTR